MTPRTEKSELTQDRFTAALEAAGIKASAGDLAAGHAIACWLVEGLASLVEAETDNAGPEGT